MPVVRELVNRISFKVNPADKKNAQDTISKIDQGILKTISNAKKLGKVLGASIIAGVGIGTKSIVDFRKEISETRFFARDKEEADAINSIFSDIAKKNEFIGRSMAQRAAASISQLNIEKQQIKQLAPLLAEIDRIRDKLDFSEVAEQFKEAIKGGDITILERLLPGSKKLAEQISKSKFGQAFADVTQKQKTEVFFDISAKTDDRLKELLAGKSEDLQFQIDSLQAVSGDLFLGIGERIESPLIRSIELARDLIKTLQGSESFWNTVSRVGEEMLEVAKFLSGIFSGTLFQESFDKSRKVREGRSEFVKSKGAAVVESGLEKTKEIDESIRSLFRVFSLDRLKRAFGIDTKEESNNQNLESLKRNIAPEQKQPDTQKTTNEQSLNINIGGTIKVENQSGVEISQVSTDLTSKVFDELKSALNNISAQNGIVTVGV